jgi:hypothetical protein
MQSDYKILKIALGFLCFIQFPAYSQWLWSDHYYEIKYHRDVIHAKGKPVIDGDFTVFTKWPENLEWRVKTKDVALIKDIGPLSPAELEKKALANQVKPSGLPDIFKPLLLLNKKEDLISLKELKQLKEEGYTNEQIWEVLIEVSNCYANAKAAGFKLEHIALFLEYHKSK